jgi:hypothetical protein
MAGYTPDDRSLDPRARSDRNPKNMLVRYRLRYWFAVSESSGFRSLKVMRRLIPIRDQAGSAKPAKVWGSLGLRIHRLLRRHTI